MTIPSDIAQTIVAPRAYADGDRVDQAFSWLRKAAPLDVAELEGHDPFWVVTRHADLLEVERQNDLFLSGDRSVSLITVEADRKVRQLTGGSPSLLRTVVQMDGPEHRAYRHLTQGWFMPQNLRALETRIRELAREAVDRMADLGGECDFARDVAFLYPLQVFMEVLGVPPVDEARMLRLTQELFGSADPDLRRADTDGRKSDLVGVQATIADFMTYFNAMIEDRRRTPREDLASVIANGQIEGKPIGHLEAISYYIVAATAGHDTTSNTTAGALWALAERPDEFRKLKADMSKIPGHVDESLRWVTTVKHFMRTAAMDTELAGKKIAKGDWLFLSYQSANRDETAFSDPFRYDIDRTPNKHVSFGYGAHVCLGQHLARMEMRILWEELLPRLKSVELAGVPERTIANFVCGPKTVPIRYVMN